MMVKGSSSSYLMIRVILLAEIRVLRWGLSETANYSAYVTGRDDESGKLVAAVVCRAASQRDGVSGLSFTRSTFC